MQKRSAIILTLLAGFTISACSAFYVPTEKDDGVQRCNTGEDCDPLDDNRYVAQCIYGEGQPENSPKTCSATFKDTINCNPMAYPANHPLAEIYDDLTSTQTKALYGQCSTDMPDNRGKQGCAPNTSGGCEAGLEVINGICDDPEALYPAINPALVGGVEIAGQDALDQFCRFYFCDDSFVCAPSGSKMLCQECDPNEPYGEGGCGTLYIQGEPSPVYTSPGMNAGNCEGEIGIDAVEFGPAPEPITP